MKARDVLPPTRGFHRLSRSGPGADIDGVTTVACACGVPEASTAPRCAWCPGQGAAAAAPAATATATAPARPGRFGAPQPPTLPPSFRYSRWAKGPTTFGPLGRVVATLLLLVPLPVLAVSIAVGIGLVGVGIYGLVILPLALRHVWAQAKIPLN